MGNDHTYKPLPRAPVFAGVLGQVKELDRIIRISPVPRAPVFAGVLRQVKNNIIGSSFPGRPVV